MFVKRYGNLTLGIFFALLGAGYFLLAKMLPPSQVMKIGPDFIPKIIGFLTFAIGTLLAVNGYLDAKKFAATEMEEDETKPEYDRVLLTMVSFSIYVMMLEFVGFVIASFIYLTIQIFILSPTEKRNPALFAGIALVASLTIYTIFRHYLDVMLPQGILGYVLLDF